MGVLFGVLGLPGRVSLSDFAERFLSVSDSELMGVVNSLFNSYKFFKGEFRSEASVRKIHSIVASVLDRVIEGKGSQHDLVYARIFVSYQRSRNQIGRGLEEALVKVLDEVSKAFSDEAKRVRVATRARMFLDSLVTLSKMY